MNENKLREQICLLATSIFDRGLTHGSTGNISVRLDDNNILVTPSGSSFGRLDPNQIVKVSKSNDDKVILNVLDEGHGFIEKDTNKIFNRFYSNRPDKFGQHSGLGLNIVKNLVELHNAIIKASNRIDKKGASMEIIFPKI